MKLKAILKVKGSKVWSIRANQKISEAIEVLVAQRIGALLVFDEKGAVAGILSERDIVRGCRQNLRALGTMPVSELMTPKIITASPEDDIKDIMEVMTANRVRHIPVIGETGLEGIVSIGDVVKAVLEDSESKIRFLKEYMNGPNV